MMKGIFAGRSVLFHFGVLTMLLCMGFVAASVAMVVLTAVTGLDADSAMSLQYAQLVASILVFLFPAMAAAWLCSRQPASFLGLKQVRDVRLLMWIAAATFLILPTVSLAGHFNMQMRLPEFMAPLERLMREMEDAAMEATVKMLQNEGFVALLVNLTVIAVAAGICEEFFFRGTVLSILRRKIRNPHVAIWTVAVIFSVIHFQFYGFVPRMLLGAFMGYLMYWGRSIWAPVFAHFLNNAAVVVGMSNSALKDNVFFAQELPADDLGWFSVMAAVTLTAFFGCMRMIYRMSEKKAASRNSPC
ncbi:MAG: CPBP family intramembrane metalloprotease [Tannerella sp.]|jgi:membrane protease YdiL (CAAX protease family)|nr:CPBP family intramembrane metalloprotease [Tannerella sp.]